MTRPPEGNPCQGMYANLQLAIDDLLDRINEGVEVTVYPNGEKTWNADPVAGTYRLVPWDIGATT